MSEQRTYTITTHDGEPVEIAADSYGQAAQRFAREHIDPRAHARRTTGDLEKSGWWRAYVGVHGEPHAERAVGEPFHVG